MINYHLVFISNNDSKLHLIRKTHNLRLVIESAHFPDSNDYKHIKTHPSQSFGFSAPCLMYYSPLIMKAYTWLKILACKRRFYACNKDKYHS